MSCIQCGSCCKREPCVLGGPEEVSRISNYVGYDIRKGLSIERTPEGRWLVRVSKAKTPCRFYDTGCSIHPVKPKGGREFECWTPSTFALTYYWTPEQLQEIGFAAPWNSQ